MRPVGSVQDGQFSARERVEYVKNANYWDAKRKPKIDRVVLLPMPEASARTAALLSGQVDWIEAPAPDAVPQIKQKGFVLYANAQPHVWPGSSPSPKARPGPTSACASRQPLHQSRRTQAGLGG